jgi:hypothetical protein
MDNEHEEMIQRLTARYVAEYHAGRQPRLSEYLLRYPRYADVLADFVSYFHAVEIDLPLESEIIAPLSQTSRAAYVEAMEKVEQTGLELSDNPGSLQQALDKAQKSFHQVSQEVGLGQDILHALAQHRVDIPTIPREVTRRLAKALDQPVSALEIVLGLSRQELHHQLAAEQPSDYDIEDQSVLHVEACSFQEAIERSEHMSDSQKRNWRAILLQEGLL